MDPWTMTAQKLKAVWFLKCNFRAHLMDILQGANKMHVANYNWSRGGVGITHQKVAIGCFSVKQHLANASVLVQFYI